MAPLAGKASNLRAILAAHVSLKLMDGRRLRSAHDTQRYRARHPSNCIKSDSEPNLNTMT